MTRIISALLLAATLTACSSGPEEPSRAAPASSAAPEPVTVVVQLVDALPVEVLQNFDNAECASVPFIGEGTPVDVTLRDADGTMVGTTTLPAHGGTFSKDQGCTWRVSFDVDASTFYEATVTSAAGTATGHGESAAGDVVIPVRL